MKARNVKVIFDTNVLVSFLIGKRLTFIKDYISNGRITIVTTEDLLKEIKEVTKKIEKIFSARKCCRTFRTFGNYCRKSRNNVKTFYL